MCDWCHVLVSESRFHLLGTTVASALILFLICSLLFSLHGPRSLTLAHGLGRSEGQLINTDPGRQRFGPTQVDKR